VPLEPLVPLVPLAPELVPPSPPVSCPQPSPVHDELPLHATTIAAHAARRTPAKSPTTLSFMTQ
jgi:hypothetical protein